jgi:hypothetical protein
MPPDPELLDHVDVELARVGWLRESPGRWRPCAAVLEPGEVAPPALDVLEFASLEAGLHRLRTSWRRECLLEWVTSDTRRDSALAGGVHFQPTADLAHWLRCAVASLGGHCVAVLTGGLTTQASRSPPPQRCEDCGEVVVPSVDHVLWQCSAWSALRRVPAPQHVLSRRLCWPVPASIPPPRRPTDDEMCLLRQMATIRSAEASARRRHGGW